MTTPSSDSKYALSGKTIEISSESEEHIRFRESESALCGFRVDGQETRVISADEDPLSETSLSLCPDCTGKWLEIADEIERAPTIWCACDRAEDGELYKCGKVVAAEDALALNHPNSSGGLLAVCPECYDWLRADERNDVDAPVEEAVTWADKFPKAAVES